MPRQRLDMLVLWNPKARRAAKSEALRSRIEATSGVLLRETESHSATLALARTAARRGVPLVVAAGATAR